MSLLLSFAFDVRECIPNLLAFLGVPERECKLGQENLRFLGPPFGNHSLSLSLFSASVTFLQTCPRTVTFLLTSTIWSSFCLTIINNFLTYHVLPAEMTFTRVSIVFHVNGVIFLPHMSNEFLICDYSWTKKNEKLKCFGSCGQITSTTWKMRFVSLSKHITVAFLPNLGKHKDDCIFAPVRNTNMHSSNKRSGARVNEDVGLDSSLTCEACVLRAWISRRPLAPCK